MQENYRKTSKEENFIHGQIKLMEENDRKEEKKYRLWKDGFNNTFFLTFFLLTKIYYKLHMF